VPFAPGCGGASRFLRRSRRRLGGLRDRPGGLSLGRGSRPSAGALREAAPREGLAAYGVRDAILVLVALTFSPAGQRSTLLRSLRLDLRRPDDRGALAALAVAQLRAASAAPPERVR
jgi:hypothetical protein